MLAAVTTLLGLYGAWQVMHWGGAARRTLIGDLFVVPINIVAVVVVVQAARRAAAQPRVRRSALLLGLGLTFYLLGNVLQTVEELVPYAPPSPALSDAAYLVFYPVAFAALVGLPVARRSAREGLTLALDCAVVTLGASALIWYFSIGPTIADGGGTVATLAVSLAYPIGDMVLLVGLAALLFTGAPTGMRAALILIGAALTAFVATDLVYVWVGLHVQDEGGDLVDVGRMVGLALFAVAAAALPVLPAESGPRPPAVERHRVSWLPYVAVAVNFAVVIYLRRHDGVTPLVLYLAVALLMGLVAFREMVVQSELLLAQRALRAAQADRAVLLDRTISQGEQERVQIAGELHDGAVQRLVALGYLLERAARKGRRHDSQGVTLVEQARSELGTEIEGLRRLMADLRPPVLDSSGLEGALRDLLATVSLQAPIQVELVARLGAEQLPPDIKTVLYRVAQEALRNVVRHAAAGRVTVRLDRTGSVVVLSIDDDGVGFDAELARERLREGHFGLIGMRERIELAGGRWELESGPGRGTHIRATVPVLPTPRESRRSELDGAVRR